MSERVPLHDEAGRTVATYVTAERRDRPCADLLEVTPGVEPGDVVAAVFARLDGWIIGGAQPDIADQLIAAGALELRRGILMQLDLGDVAPAPPPPTGITIVPFAHTTSDLLSVSLAAFPLGHPDREPGSSDADEAVDMDELLSGAAVGPVAPHSRVALDPAGTVVGAAIVTTSPGRAPFGGPWLGDVFRHPDAAPAGTGAALIGAAITSLHHGGERSLGLIVTDGNPARGVYERLGFAVTRVSVSVRIGAADRAAGD